ncbi:Cof-type HAD-IIB family hydrolase [Aestuariivivens sediminicola]|uniref:Cof-type HAD-IIB family hydrolase n=1 Tax=Aestuariivivens sediminicola TaxID=2913560 RepID=UPI001F59D0FB|nr:Cof-type HAD-IIB family hydrolase [Aestuariivivens sediminicola]
MNLANIKLVVSDMDGTLLNPKGEISARFFNQFQELKRKNIHFVAASGRQYQSIVEKFGTIKDQLSIIAENGSLIRFNHTERILFKLSNKEALKAIKKLRAIKGCYIVLCARKSAYIETDDPVFVSKLSQYYTAYTIVDDLSAVKDDNFLKIAVYHFESTEEQVLPHLEDLSKDLKVVVSGKNWLDISHPEVDKSMALALVQRELGIGYEQTMVFGDYNNDLKMMDLGYFSFAMDNAHQNIKNTARFSTSSNAEEGVEDILEKLLQN